MKKKKKNGSNVAPTSKARNVGTNPNRHLPTIRRGVTGYWRTRRVGCHCYAVEKSGPRGFGVSI